MSEIITQMFVYFKYVLHLCVAKQILRYENNENI